MIIIHTTVSNAIMQLTFLQWSAFLPQDVVPAEDTQQEVNMRLQVTDLTTFCSDSSFDTRRLSFCFFKSEVLTLALTALLVVTAEAALMLLSAA
jgi:hypothetical protein